MQLESTIAQLEHSAREIEHERESTLASRQSFIMEWQKDISERLVEAQQNMTSLLKSLDKINRLNDYVELRAPCEAIVHEIASFPVGSAVREAEALITLVPISEIEVEAEIPAQDIGKVKVGDSVRVKLNAYPFQKYGTLDGIIRKLSPDAFTKQGAAPIDPEAGKSYYRAWISLSGSLRNVPDTFRLTPGMEVQAEIKVGTRSVLEYIIHPLVKSLDEAIREP
jgi:HlyD family secretion protein